LRSRHQLKSIQPAKPAASESTMTRKVSILPPREPGAPAEPRVPERRARVPVGRSGRPDRPAEGLGYIEQAMRLDPHRPPSFLIMLGAAQFAMDHFEEAATTFERAVKLNPDNELPLVNLASSYGHQRRIGKVSTRLTGRGSPATASGTTRSGYSCMPWLTISATSCELWPYPSRARADRGRPRYQRSAQVGPRSSRHRPQTPSKGR
jgi:hypothetical protein